MRAWRTTDSALPSLTLGTIASATTLAPNATKKEKKIQAALENAEFEKAAKGLAKIVADPHATPKARSWAKFELAEVMLKTGRYEDSVTYYQSALGEGYAADQAAFGIATAQYQMGDDEAAPVNLSYALDLGFAESDKLSKTLQQWDICPAATGEEMVERAAKHASEQDYKKKKGNKLKQKKVSSASSY